MNYKTDLLWHRLLLLSLAERMKPRSYLELGLGSSPALLMLWQHCENVYGVDHNQIDFTPPKNATIYKMTTDDFFGTVPLPVPPELVLIDADHNAEQVLKDLWGVRNICAVNCMVLLHDTFPEGEMYTHPTHCGNAWEVPAALGGAFVEHVTIPAPPGVTICRLRQKRLF